MGELSSGLVHLCVDMQRIFAKGGIWQTPWMERVLPNVARIAGKHPDRTVFTRFITPHHPDQMSGTWRDYYRKWHKATRAELDPEMLSLMPELASLTPPAGVLDKMFYSAFAATPLDAMLRDRQAAGIIVTGSETDVCVLSTVMSAVDLGWRVVLVTDAVCSSSDRGHDNLLEVYGRRYGQHIDTIETEELLSCW